VRSYVIGKELGHGAFARVFKATNQTTNEQFALKIIPLRPNDPLPFRQEVSIMAYLDHPNLVSLKETFTDDNFLYLALDLCEGGDLFKYIVDQGPLDEPTCALIFTQVVSAIAHCHASGIAHRDLKPENILITTFPCVKITDFGLAGIALDGQLSSVFCGSACYLAPECHCKIAYDGKKADIWSLGVLLFALATGNFPWPITHRSTMIRQILRGDYSFPDAMSAECRSLAGGMLQVNPNCRLGMAQILEHPFLKLAEQSPFHGKIVLPSLTPPAPASAEAVLAAVRPGAPGRENLADAGLRPARSQGIAAKAYRAKPCHRFRVSR
jgi:serine/threonine protein kinase